jgi:uncharacterized protein (TIGR02118 family)
MAPRRPDMTIDQFQHHWRTSHADAAGQIPGLLRYTQNHSLVEFGRYLLGYPGFDACSELDFESVAAMESGFASETYQTVVRDDEDDFVDKARFSIVVATPEIIIDGPADGVKLISMYRTHPSRTREELLATLSGPVADDLGATGMRYVVYQPVDEPYSGPAASFDAVATLWLGRKGAGVVKDVLASPQWAASELTLAGIASGTVMLAATTVEVV